MNASRGSTTAGRLLGWGLAFAGAVLLTLASHVGAQTLDEPGARALTGVLKRIKAAGVVRIGFRERAIPFAFEGSGKRPYGYSIDLCDAIVESIAAEIGVALLRTEYLRVTPADRIEQVAAAGIDLECGATTNTAQRRERVAFSPLDLRCRYAAAGQARQPGALAARIWRDGRWSRFRHDERGGMRQLSGRPDVVQRDGGRRL